jgi:superfamily II DNA helicase RecQ
MHSYADRYTHKFFFERDYPNVTVLDAIFSQLRSEPHEKAFLMPKIRIDEEMFDKAIEKLWIHGGAVVDYAENVSRGHDHWRESYVAQGEQKGAQIDQMMRFAESNQCRMAALVRHFGDLADGQKPCGICDFCAPKQCAAQRFRTATQAEYKMLLRVVAALRPNGAKSTGKLYNELCLNNEMSRDAFEEVLGAAARAGLLHLSDEAFQKDGKQIPYRKASLTRSGATVDELTPVEFVMKNSTPPSGKRKRKASRTVPTIRERVSKPGTAAGPRPKAKRTESEMDIRLEAALRNWRLVEARRLGLPAFRILSDRSLRALATSHAMTTQALLAIPGIGANTVAKYGTNICRVLRESGG